jgi:hypothetical protein
LILAQEFGATLSRFISFLTVNFVDKRILEEELAKLAVARFSKREWNAGL